jgi:hypothetical protein
VYVLDTKVGNVLSFILYFIHASLLEHDKTKSTPSYVFTPFTNGVTLSVVALPIDIGVEYKGDDIVGAEPSVVYLICVPGTPDANDTNTGADEET